MQSFAHDSAEMCLKNVRVRQAAREGGTRLYFLIHKFFVRLIWNTKLCSQRMHSLDRMGKFSQSKSVMADVKVRVRLFQAMQDYQSENYMDDNYYWMLHQC